MKKKKGKEGKLLYNKG